MQYFCDKTSLSQLRVLLNIQISSPSSYIYSAKGRLILYSICECWYYEQFEMADLSLLVVLSDFDNQ